MKLKTRLDGWLYLDGNLMPKYQNKRAECQMTLPHLQWLSLLLGFSGSKFPFNHVRNYEKKQNVQRDFQLPHPTSTSTSTNHTSSTNQFT
jgi:hypothetical protein